MSEYELPRNVEFIEVKKISDDIEQSVEGIFGQRPLIEGHVEVEDCGFPTKDFFHPRFHRKVTTEKRMLILTVYIDITNTGLTFKTEKEEG